MGAWTPCLPRSAPLIPIVVVGAGWVGEHRHIPSMRRTGSAEVIGVIDRHVDRAERIARKFGLPHFADSLDAPWLEHAKAATVAVSPDQHHTVATHLIDRDLHVLLEKPMCVNVADAVALAEHATANRRTLAIVHNFQFARSAMHAKQKIASGEWGRVTGLAAMQMSNPGRRLPVWYDDLPGGLFFDESPHLLYLLRAFGGDLTLDSARLAPSSTGNTPSIVTAELHAGDIPATLTMHFEAPISEWQIVVMTEAGAAAIDVFRDILVFVPNDGRHEPRDVVRSSFAMLAGHTAGFIRSGVRMVTRRLDYGNIEVCRRFLDSIETGTPPHDINADTALDILRMQHEILDRGGA